MTIEGVDYSTSRPSPSALYAAGKRFVVRYGGPGSSGKQLTLTEARALTAAGLSIVANAEGSTGGLMGGRSAGASWATSSAGHFASCGMPADRPIYLSADWDVQASEWPAVANALRGAASVIGLARVGIYGGRNAIKWARRDGVAQWFWQTYAWSGGLWVGGNHIEQYKNNVTVAGGDCDLDRTRVADYGQWGQAAPTPVPSPIPSPSAPTVYQEEEMILTCTDGSGTETSVNGVTVPMQGRVLATPNGPWSLSGNNVGGFDGTFWRNTPQMKWQEIKDYCAKLVPPASTTPVQVQIDAAPVAAAIVADPSLGDLIYNKSFQAAQDSENR